MEGTHRIKIYEPRRKVKDAVGQFQFQNPPNYEHIAWAQLNPSRRSGRQVVLDGVELSTQFRVYRIRQTKRLEDGIDTLPNQGGIKAGWSIQTPEGQVYKITFIDPVVEPQARWWDLYVSTTQG